MSEILFDGHAMDDVTILPANADGPPEKKKKKLSYKDDISIPIQREGHRIILDPEYLSQERAKVQREELPYFRNLIQAAEGKRYLIVYTQVTTDISFSVAALGDDPELEPSWTAISQSNQEWFADEYLPSILDEWEEEKQVHIRDPTKMSVDERWACLEQWYSIGHLQMLAWKPRTMSKSLTPLPLEDCWWHSAFPGKQSRIRRGKRKRQTKRGGLAPQLPESEDPLPGKSVSNSSNSQELAPGTSALPSSSESILGTPASEPRTSEESVQGTLRSPSPESSELIPRSFGIRSRDRTPDSQQPIPTQPYSASTALARVDRIHTAADIRRREGHAQYQLGLEQRRINRKVRRAAHQDALTVGSVQIPHRASDPDAGPSDMPVANIDATTVDISVSDKASYPQRQRRKRKQNMAISDSESEGRLADAPGLTHHSEQHARDSTPVPDSRSGKGSFVVLLSPFQRPSKSKKHRSGM